MSGLTADAPVPTPPRSRRLRGLFGPNPPPLLPSFRYAATFQPQYVSVILRDLRARGFGIDESLLTATFDLHHGDLVSVGRGEILFRHAV